MCVSTYFPRFWAFPQDPTYLMPWAENASGRTRRAWDSPTPAPRSNGEIQEIQGFCSPQKSLLQGCFDSTEERPWKKGLLGVERTFSY